MAPGPFIEWGESLRLSPSKIYGGVQLKGEHEGAAVTIAQYAIAMGPDPTPRPMTSLTVDCDVRSRGGVMRATRRPDHPTGEERFDARFAWFSPQGSPLPRYLESAELRAELLSIDAGIAQAVGHEGIPVFQIDHIDGGIRMTILTHVPDPLLLERTLRLLVTLAGSLKGE